MRLIYLLLILSILSTSCEKEEKTITVEVEKEYSWKRHSDFNARYGYILNSFAEEEKLYTWGPNGFSTLDVNSFDDKEDGSFSHTLSPTDNDYEIQYPIGKDIFVFNRDSTLYIANSREANSQGDRLRIKLSELDPTAYLPIYIHHTLGQKFGLNDNNQVLVVYHDIENTVSGFKAALLNVKYDPSQTFNKLSIEKTQIIPLNYFDQNDFTHIFIHDQNFFVSNYDGTYKINSDGTHKLVSNEFISDAFELNGELYGFNLSNYFKSFDGGDTWHNIGECDSFYGKFNYRYINGRVIGYRYSQLAEVVIKDDQIIFEELKADGMEHHDITSISEINDRVFVTTLSGVYSKSLEDFFDRKDLDE